MKKLDFVIAFDITDNKRLKKVSKKLEQQAFRIQLSVFYIKCDLRTIKGIIKTIIELIDIDEDDFRVYRVDLKRSIFLRSSQNVRELVI